MQNLLQAKVKARNRLNAIVLKTFPLIVAAVAEFKGEKVKLANGSLSKKFLDKLPKSNETEGYTLLYECSVYVIRARWTVTEEYAKRNGNFGFTHYETASFLVGDTTDGVLVDSPVYSQTPWVRTDYTEGEVESLRKEISLLERVLTEKKNQLGSFGENDN